MDEMLIGWISTVTTTIAERLDSIIELVTISPSAYNNAIWVSIQAIAQNVVKPIAFIVLSFFALMELYHVFLNYNSQSQVIPEHVFKAAFKVVLLKVFVDKSMTVMLAIFGIVAEIIQKANSVLPSGGALSAGDSARIADEIRNMDILAKLLLGGETLLIYVVIQILGILAWLLAMARMLELYIYISIAPIPIATLVHNEQGAIGKNFLKSFTAVALNGFFMVIIIAIYKVIVDSVTVSGSIETGLFLILQWSALLVFALFKTERWSKSIMSAN